MASHRTALFILFAATFAGSASAGTVTGSTSFNGRDVAYELTGDSLSVNSSAKNGMCTVDAVVDGTKHQITVSASQLRWNKEKVALNGFTKVDITIDRNTVTIAVDGKVVIPKKKKRRSTIHRVIRPLLATVSPVSTSGTGHQCRLDFA